MDNLKKRVAYLQGLARGMELHTDTKEGRLLTDVIDVLDDMAHSVDNLWGAQRELENYIETIDKDLFDLETGTYDDEEEYVEVRCAHCHEKVYFDADIIDAEDVIEVTCPNCDEVVFVNDGSLDFNHSIIANEVENPEMIPQTTNDI